MIIDSTIVILRAIASVAIIVKLEALINAATFVVTLDSYLPALRVALFLLSSAAALRWSSLALPLKKWTNSARFLTLPAGQAVSLRFFGILDVENVLFVVFQSVSGFAAPI